ncbi:CIC11C00000002953 [Sungouiella intermedia]|uniref:CIC11C00000002953 n=1 Tax=Sungouiella intermedia TaxID=45354 RepID=A0A1L0FYM5_9ASCO|nr:CIC11C00000002953 [[Candida] intermedia]
MNPKLFHIIDYRGATVEDLDIRPAISINPSTALQRAIEVSFENEFTYLPVIHETNKRLLGVLNVEEFKVDPLKASKSCLKPITKNYMHWFNQKARAKYEQESTSKNTTPLNLKILKPKTSNGKKFEVLTPLTPLEGLAQFFNTGNYFAIITNGDGNLVYGVVTPEDLIKYENSRPRL